MTVEKLPYTFCPRFEKCNVNICPLDPDWEPRNRLPGDPKCTMEKGVRLRLGKNLSTFGLKPLELKAKRQWDGLSEEKREARPGHFYFSQPFKEGIMKTKHTSGPWTITHQTATNYSWDIIGGGSIVASAGCQVTKDGRCGANARLISAAPELLEALKEALADHYNSKWEQVIAKAEGI